MTYYALLLDSDGCGYQELLLSKERDGSKVLCSLKEGEWSGWLREIFIVEGEEKVGAVRFKLVKLSRDGRELILYRSQVYPLSGFTHPPEIGGELTEKFGPYINESVSTAFFAGFVDEKTLVEEFEYQIRLISNAARYLMDKYNASLYMMHWHFIDALQHTVLGMADPVGGMYDPDKAEWARLQGYEVIGDPRDLIGDGWWRYDVEEASKLLEKHGFYKDEQGRWHLPDGTLWKINMVASADHPLLSVLIFGVADQWRKFGIDVTVETVPAAVMSKRWQLGDFDVAVVCPIAVQTPDIWRHYQGYHKMYYKPLGQVATGCQNRWVNDEFSALLDKMVEIPPFTPEAIRLGFEAITILIRDMPFTNLFLGSKALIVDNYVWTNWPVYETNWYWEMLYWNPVWAQVMFVYLKPTGNVPSSELYMEYVTVWFVRDVPSFIGVDGAKYGPYSIGDRATIPKDDADRLLAEGKATTTPAIPGIDEIIKGVSSIRDSIEGYGKLLSSIQNSITNLDTNMEKQIAAIEALKTSIDGLYMMMNAILAIAIITVVLAGIALVRIKKV